MELSVVKNRIHDIYNGKFSLKENTYIDTTHKATFICNEHNECFDAFFTNMFQGKCAGCNICKETNPPKREISLEKVKEKIGNKPIKIIGHHRVKSHIYIDLKCMICETEFSQRKDGIVYKNNNIDCPNCENKLKEFYDGVWHPIKKTPEQYKKEVYDLVGDEYSVLEDYKGAFVSIDMKHNVCHNTWKSNPNSFLCGRRCPFCRKSLGEEKIMSFLNLNNIDFVYEKKFSNLLGVGNGFLSYDFYLPKYNLLIEFQGEQHEHPRDYFGGEEALKIQQEHDQRKRNYAEQNNIDLLEIWYYDFKNIEQILESRLLKQSA